MNADDLKLRVGRSGVLRVMYTPFSIRPGDEGGYEVHDDRLWDSMVSEGHKSKGDAVKAIWGLMVGE